jgi:hypothetical protein
VWVAVYVDRSSSRHPGHMTSSATKPVTARPTSLGVAWTRPLSLSVAATYRRMGDARWLARARSFAMHAIGQSERARKRYGQRRYTLWTDDGGLAVFLHHCAVPEASFFTGLEGILNPHRARIVMQGVPASSAAPRRSACLPSCGPTIP